MDPPQEAIHTWRRLSQSQEDSQWRRKEHDALGAANQERAMQNWRTDSQLSQFIYRISQEILILRTCRILISSFYLFLSEPRKPSFDRVGGHLQKLNNSTV